MGHISVPLFDEIGSRLLGFDRKGFPYSGLGQVAVELKGATHDEFVVGSLTTQQRPRATGTTAEESGVCFREDLLGVDSHDYFFYTKKPRWCYGVFTP